MNSIDSDLGCIFFVFYKVLVEHLDNSGHINQYFEASSYFQIDFAYPQKKVLMKSIQEQDYISTIEGSDLKFNHKHVLQSYLNNCC